METAWILFEAGCRIALNFSPAIPLAVLFIYLMEEE